MTKTWFGATGMPSVTSLTGILVTLEMSSVRWLSCVGSRCCTSTKAILVSVGRCVSNCVNASRPPAEAPMPTIGNAAGGCSASRSEAAGFGLDRSADRLDGTFALLLVALAGGLTMITDSVRGGLTSLLLCATRRSRSSRRWVHVRSYDHIRRYLMDIVCNRGATRVGKTRVPHDPAGQLSGLLLGHSNISGASAWVRTRTAISAVSKHPHYTPLRSVRKCLDPGCAATSKSTGVHR